MIVTVKKRVRYFKVINKKRAILERKVYLYQRPQKVTASMEIVFAVKLIQ
jgi:hypothetical protein|tara:strand:+ start:79 stop:228 length:150 start_codon:yes stop_codon:yes gene_type:complete